MGRLGLSDSGNYYKYYIFILLNRVTYIIIVFILSTSNLLGQTKEDQQKTFVYDSVKFTVLLGMYATIPDSVFDYLNTELIKEKVYITKFRGGVFYQVEVGRYHCIDKAERMIEKLTNAGYKIAAIRGKQCLADIPVKDALLINKNRCK